MKTSFSTLPARLHACWISFRALPRWVQWWVGAVLVPVNAAPFLFLDLWTGRLVAGAAALVALTNLPIMVLDSGMSKRMSIPHLLIWGPLEYILIMRLLGRGAPWVSAFEWRFCVVIVLVNGISLGFDLLESWRWFRGDRGVPGPGCNKRTGASD